MTTAAMISRIIFTAASGTMKIIETSIVAQSSDMAVILAFSGMPFFSV